MSLPHPRRADPCKGPGTSTWLLPPCLFALGALTGCNPTGPVQTPVSGIVTLESVPLTGARVQFIPQGDTLGHGGSGITSDDGRYEIVVHRTKSKGLVPGEYKVVVTRLLLADGTPLPPNVPQEGSGARESIPEPYCRRDLSPLTVTVGADARSFDFSLKKN